MPFAWNANWRRAKPLKRHPALRHDLRISFHRPAVSTLLGSLRIQVLLPALLEQGLSAVLGGTVFPTAWSTIGFEDFGAMVPCLCPKELSGRDSSTSKGKLQAARMKRREIRSNRGHDQSGLHSLYSGCAESSRFSILYGKLFCGHALGFVEG